MVIGVIVCWFDVVKKSRRVSLEFASAFFVRRNCGLLIVFCISNTTCFHLLIFFRIHFVHFLSLFVLSSLFHPVSTLRIFVCHEARAVTQMGNHIICYLTLSRKSDGRPWLFPNVPVSCWTTTMVVVLPLVVVPLDEVSQGKNRAKSVHQKQSRVLFLTLLSALMTLLSTTNYFLLSQSHAQSHGIKIKRLCWPLTTTQGLTVFEEPGLIVLRVSWRRPLREVSSLEWSMRLPLFETYYKPTITAQKKTIYHCDDSNMLKFEVCLC